MGGRSSIVGLIVFAVMLEGQGKHHRLVAADSMDMSTLHHSESDSKIQNLQSEITKLQEMVARSFKEMTSVSPSSVAKVKVTTPVSTTQKIMNIVQKVDKSVIAPSSSHITSGFDLKGLEKEIELLQKQLYEEVTEPTSKIPKKSNKKTKVNNDAFTSNVNPQARISDRIPQEIYYPHPYYPHFNNYAHLIQNKPQPKADKNNKKDIENKEEEIEDLIETSEEEEEDGKLRLIGSSGKSIVLELVLEVLKLFAGGDGKGIIGLALKLPPLIVKGLLSGIALAISKGGIKGVLIRYLVPLIVLIGINLLVVFMAWWLWEDSSCAKVEEVEHKPFVQPSMYGYGSMNY